jgi:hypothetical protein
MFLYFYQRKNSALKRRYSAAIAYLEGERYGHANLARYGARHIFCTLNMLFYVTL